MCARRKRCRSGSSTSWCIRRSCATSRSSARTSSPTARCKREHATARGATGIAARRESGRPRASCSRRRARRRCKKTHGNYPAPLAAIDAVAAGYARRRRARVSRGGAAVRRAGGDDGVAAADLPLLRHDRAQEGHRRPEPTRRRRSPVEKLGILGAGFMGAGIASIAAQQGTLVRLKDADTGASGRDSPRCATCCRSG